MISVFELLGHQLRSEIPNVAADEVRSGEIHTLSEEALLVASGKNMTMHGEFGRFPLSRLPTAARAPREIFSLHCH